MIGLLCCLDQPLILVFDQVEGLWLEGNRPVLLRFGEVIKELFTHVPHALVLVTLFPDRWQQFQADFDGSITGRVAQHVIQLEQPRPDQIEAILDLRLEPLGASSLELFSIDELASLVRQPSIRSCLNRAGALFEHRVRGIPLPALAPASAVPTREQHGFALNQRLLGLEQQLALILHRLDALEGQRTPKDVATSDALAPKLVPQRMEPEDVMDAEVRLEPTTGSSTPALDETVISYESLFLRYYQASLQTLRQRWEHPQIIDESDDAGKLRQICLGYQQIRPLRLGALRLGNKRAPDNLLIEGTGPSRCIAFLHVANATSVNARLRNLNQLVLQKREVQFILMRDVSAPEIRSRQASEALAAFKNGCGEGRKRTFWRPLDLQRRVALEFVHQLVSDILNRELDLPLQEGSIYWPAMSRRTGW